MGSRESENSKKEFLPVIHDRVGESARELLRNALGSCGGWGDYLSRSDIGVGVPEGSIEVLGWFLRTPPGQMEIVLVKDRSSTRTMCRGDDM